MGNLTSTEAILQSYLGYPIGWDSYGGLPLRKDVHDLARVILRFLKDRYIPEPYIVLGSGGTLGLEWSKGEWDMQVEVTSGHSVIVYQQFSPPSNIVEYEIRRGLPKSLSVALDWFYW